jgi:hypothetical protein
MVPNDQHLNVRMIAAHQQCNVWFMLTKHLEVVEVYTKMVPRKLTEDHHQQKMDVWHYFMQQIEENDKWLKSCHWGW